MGPSADSSSLAVALPRCVRLFPLPNLVMFPHVVQPLHIFEPRYCDLLEEALAGDRLIAMVLLEPGWERDYEGRPPIAKVACVGKVVAHERLPSGKHNILLRGLKRAAIQRELPMASTFRQAEVDWLDDVYPPAGAKGRAATQQQLIELARELLPGSQPLQEELDQFGDGENMLGMLTDVFAFTLGFPVAVKRRLLVEVNVDRRAALVNEQLAACAAQRQAAPGGDGAVEFPPRFSVN